LIVVTEDANSPAPRTGVGVGSELAGGHRQVPSAWLLVIASDVTIRNYRR
jgi:hypothetical protein